MGQAVTRHGGRGAIITAVEMVALISLTAFAGHALAGKPAAPAANQSTPPPVVSSPPAAVQPVFNAPGVAPRHILWLFVNGRWRAVPS